MTHELNIAPIETALGQISDRISRMYSTLIGQSIYTKFLLSSKMVHIIAQMSDPTRLENIEKIIVKSIWRRTHLSSGVVNQRTHIARHWLVQPIFLRTLWTKVKQNKVDPNTTDFCTLCNQHPEHTIHLMWSCPVAQLAWNKLKEVTSCG